jgi:hypothetical protein
MSLQHENDHERELWMRMLVKYAGTIFIEGDVFSNADAAVKAFRARNKSLAPTPGTEGGDGSPVVNQDKPGPGAIDVQHGASVDPSARAALSRAFPDAIHDTPASTWLPGESDGTR